MIIEALIKKLRKVYPVGTIAITMDSYSFRDEGLEVTYNVHVPDRKMEQLLDIKAVMLYVGMLEYNHLKVVDNAEQIANGGK